MRPMTLEQTGRAVQEKWQENAVGLGEIERAFQSAPGGASVAERVACDRLQQENLNQPAAGIRYRGGIVEGGRERLGRRLRVVLREPKRRQDGAYLLGPALVFVHLGDGGFDASGFAQPYEGVQQERSGPPSQSMR